MKQYILALVLAVVSASVAFAVNPIKEGNMISGHVIVKGTEENIPYATVLIIGSGQGTVSNEEGHSSASFRRENTSSVCRPWATRPKRRK